MSAIIPHAHGCELRNGDWYCSIHCPIRIAGTDPNSSAYKTIHGSWPTKKPFELGDKVFKPAGYPYPGVVVAVFTNLAGETRMVVESIHAPGMLHIFSPKQMEHEA